MNISPSQDQDALANVMRASTYQKLEISVNLHARSKRFTLIATKSVKITVVRAIIDHHLDKSV